MLEERLERIEERLAFRSSHRLVQHDTTLAASLWERLKGHLRSGVPHDLAAVGLNERFRVYRYEHGQAFRWHRDGAFVRDERERSRLTFMVYLNGGFTGGATEFEDEHVIPEEGLAVVFAHGLRHQGAEVIEGRKYVLRSDVMFRR